MQPIIHRRPVRKRNRADFYEKHTRSLKTTFVVLFSLMLTFLILIPVFQYLKLI
ncbi:MAG TPA: hypothetical protein VHK69_21040 [Chitinophagaceae bacterium]|jgi:hypothetical protein|nr:hypothetical protein [Chitinophagaceae bacterium]